MIRYALAIAVVACSVPLIRGPAQAGRSPAERAPRTNDRAAEMLTEGAPYTLRIVVLWETQTLRRIGSLPTLLQVEV